MEKTVWTSKRIKYLYCGNDGIDAAIEGVYVRAGNAETSVFIMDNDGNLLGIARRGMLFCQGRTVICGIDCVGGMCFEVTK